MKKFTYLKQVVVFVTVLSVGLVFHAQAATTADAAPAQTLLESKIVFNAASQVGVVGGAKYGPGGAWCGDFVTWVLFLSGVAYGANGRGALNPRVARSWAVHGANGGGYGRWGGAGDAMPGDLLIDRYNGTATTGGHISIVVESQVGGNRNVVRTVGGNESNSVRSQIKTLNTDSRYLVTLAELRTQTSPLTGGGALVTRRSWSGYGAVTSVHSIWDTQTGRVYSGAALSSAPYWIRARNAFTGQTTYFIPSQTIATEIYRNLVIFRRTGLSSMVQIGTITYN